MLLKVQLFLSTLQFFFLCSVITQDLKVSVELDSVAETKDNQLSVDLSGNEENVQMTEGDKKQSTEDGTNVDGKEESSKDITNDHVDNEEDKTAPLNLKNDKGVKEEPGFDLTTEEMLKFKIWKNGVIPYYIDVVSYSDKVFRDSIRSFLRMVNDVTGLNFEELPNPPSNDNERWVFFINRRGLLGCADHTTKNFTNHGVQQVVLGYDCFATKGELAEAVMSIVGVPAQHNAPDRDIYIKVNTENVLPDKRHLFEKLRDDEWLFHDLEYDLHSVTHYDMHKYSANSRATIEAKKNFEDIVPTKSLSPIDFLKIKMLYNYITRNKKLQVPECRKLFKPRSKYERFVPNDEHNIKPRKKPSRYTSIVDNDDENTSKPSDQSIEAEENEGEHNDNESYNEENEEQVDEYNEEDEEEDDEEDEEEAEEHETLNNSEYSPNSPSVNTTENATNSLSIEKLQENLDPIAMLDDHKTQEIHQLKSSRGPLNDPLFLLSDYGSDYRKR